MLDHILNAKVVFLYIYLHLDAKFVKIPVQDTISETLRKNENGAECGVKKILCPGGGGVPQW